MRKVPLWSSFLLTLLVALFGTALFPSIHLIPFAPLLALVYNRFSLRTALWLAVFCGLIFDLLCSQLRFGLYALNYCVTTLLLYPQKRHFFEDKPVALSLFTALVSSLSTLIQLVLLYTFDKGLFFTWNSALTDLIFMPCADACYAYLVFSCALTFHRYIQRVDVAALGMRLRDRLRKQRSQSL